MLHRFYKITSDAMSGKIGRSTTMTIMHQMVTSLGIAAILAWVVLLAYPDIAARLKPDFTHAAEEADDVTASPLTDPMRPLDRMLLQQANPALENGASDPKALGTAHQQRWVTTWLARKYRVAANATNMLVSTAYLTADDVKIDPLLILAVMAIESGFNPFAESPVGAQGLMQVMSKVHHDKFQELGGIQAAFNPVANIRVGARILKDYVRRGGSVEAGLKLYVGAADAQTDYGYGARVLAEYRRLQAVSTGKKVPLFATSPATAKPQHPAAPVEIEAMTTESA